MSIKLKDTIYDNIDKLDGYHRSDLFESIPTWISASGLSKNITVAGNSSNFYPVVISVSLSKSMPTYISIYKDLGTTTPSLDGNHSNGTSSLWLRYEMRNTMWDGNGGYIKTLYKYQGYATLVAHTRTNTKGHGGLIVWLRGGTCAYTISCTNTFTADIYYSSTNIGSTDYPDTIAPMTAVDNGGIYTSTIFGYGDLYGNASTASKLKTARTISLTGAITGTGTFDGSDNLTISTSVSHTHNYTSTIKIGTSATEYKCTDNNITLPAYPTLSSLGASPEHTHPYLPLSGGTLTGDFGANDDTKTPYYLTTKLNHVRKNLNWSNGIENSYIEHVIPLIPVPTTKNWIGINYIDGKFLMWKKGGNVYDVVEVNLNCVYNVLYYTFTCSGNYSDSYGLCIVKYNGISYYAIDCPYHANPYTDVEFYGSIKSTLTGGTSSVALPLDIEYYNANTKTVLNSEVYNSKTTTLTTSVITTATVYSLRSIGGFSGDLTGNVTGNASSSTKLATTRTLWGQNFNGTANVSGDMTGVGSISMSKSLTLTGTDSTTAAISFSRASYNYIHAPASGLICLQPNGMGASSAAGYHFNGTEFFPAANSTYTLGTSSKKWKNVYATTFTGALDGNASSSTYTTNIRVTATNPTSATNYGVIWAANSSTTSSGSDNYIPRANNGFIYRTLEGTTSALGYGILILGNSTASGTAGNKYGMLRLYSESSGYVNIRPGSASTSNYTLYLPGADGQLVHHTNDTAIGSATKPVYISSSGAATACSVASGDATASTIAVRNSSGDIYARLIRQTYEDQETISGGIVYRVNNSTDNYLRVCKSTSAIREYLGVPSSSDLSSYLPRQRMTNPDPGHASVGTIPLILALKSAGTPVYTDPEFKNGVNSCYVYNNYSNGTVTISHITDNQNSGNSSGKILQISTTTGTATPGRGGFYQAMDSRAGAVFCQIFRAKIPIGFTLANNENSMGSGYKTYWMTNKAGTGKWEWYCRITICGTSGTFGSGGHVSLNSDAGGNVAVTWYLSYCNVIDLTKGHHDGLRAIYSDSSLCADKLGTFKLSDGTVTGVDAGTATKPVYFSGGVPTACTYSLNKTVPSDAVFTDTKNTAGSTNSSSKLFLIGATSQAANPQTYSHDTAYVGTDGCLYSNGTKVSVEGHTHDRVKTVTPSGSAGGWYRVGTISTSNAGYSQNVIISLQRSYYSPENEHYIFSISVGYNGHISITQLSGYKGGQLIDKIRVVYNNSGNCYFDYYMKSGSYNNGYRVTVLAGDFKTLEDIVLVTSAGGSVTEFTTTNGCKSNYGFTGDLTGNATTATTASKLAASRTISLTGAITGSGTFDGSNNLSIATSVSHTHNYAGSSSAGGDANNSVKWGGYKIVVGSTGSDTSTIYFVT